MFAVRTLSKSTTSGARTHGHKIKSLALYRLSYGGFLGMSVNLIDIIFLNNIFILIAAMGGFEPPPSDCISDTLTIELHC